MPEYASHMTYAMHCFDICAAYTLCKQHAEYHDPQPLWVAYVVTYARVVYITCPHMPRIQTRLIATAGYEALIASRPCQKPLHLMQICYKLLVVGHRFIAIFIDSMDSMVATRYGHSIPLNKVTPTLNHSEVWQDVRAL